jgi:ribosomal protein S18 acetylase RimI-like enzyme
MEIQVCPLRDAHYASVKDIFSKSFTEDICTLDDLAISWEQRSKPDSFGFFCPVSPTARTRSQAMIGFVIASFSTSSGNSMYIDYFALRPEMRGTGIGTMMLTKLLKKCYESRGSIHLYPARDELVGWYERNGFHHSSNKYYVFHSYETRTQHVIHKGLSL